MKFIYKLNLSLATIIFSTTLLAQTKENLCYKYFDQRIHMGIELDNCNLNDDLLIKLIPKINSEKIQITEIIDLTNNRITDRGIEKLASGFSTAAAWDNIWLYLGDNPITSLAVKAIAKNSHIKSLSLSNMYFTEDAASALINSSIERIFFTNIHVSSKTALILANKPNWKQFSLNQNDSVIDSNVIDALEKQSELELLSFNNTVLSIEDVKKLMSLPALEYLKLSRVKLPVGAMELLSANKTLRTLTLNDMDISDSDLSILSHSENIRDLRLENDNIHFSGAKILANNSNLYDLNVDNNPIGNKGALVLGQSSYLRYLSLGNIGLTTEGAIALVQTLHPHIQSLNLSHNPIGDAAVPYLLNAFYDKCAHSLRLDYTLISDAGLQQLKPAKNLGCAWVSLAGNHIGPAGAKGLLNFFGTKPDSAYIYLNDNNLGDAGLAILADVAYKGIELKDNHFSRKALEGFIAKMQCPFGSIKWNEKTLADF